MIAHLWQQTHNSSHQFNQRIGAKETFITEDKIRPLSEQALAHAPPDLHIRIRYVGRVRERRGFGLGGIFYHWYNRVHSF